jgi:hypothetical protein
LTPNRLFTEQYYTSSETLALALKVLELDLSFVLRSQALKLFGRYQISKWSRQTGANPAIAAFTPTTTLALWCAEKNYSICCASDAERLQSTQSHKT